MAQPEQPGSTPAIKLAPPGRRLLAMTVDVEDYFHVSAFRDVVSISDWDRMPAHVEENTDRVLDLFAKYDCRATFFVLGWVAERCPALVRRIQRAGHELGCHSYAHRLIYELTREEFRRDTCRALRAIEDAAGVAVRTFRAPSFSITRSSAWALEVLAELGIELDSSVFPIRHDLYGFSRAPRVPFRIRMHGGSLVEFPPPTIRIAWINFPVTGGGYLRQLPMGFQMWSMKRWQRKGAPFLIYFHPWEIDPDQPKIEGSFVQRLRHYRGLESTADRLQSILGCFCFRTITEVAMNSGPLPEFCLTRTAKKQFSLRSLQMDEAAI